MGNIREWIVQNRVISFYYVILFLSFLFSGCGESNLGYSQREVISAGYSENGSAIYAAHCASCHGKNPESANSEFTTGPALSAVTSQEIQKVVRSGKGEMPKFDMREISTRELSDLATYITNY
jgi:mono/diheme cytochrome c family protein